MRSLWLKIIFYPLIIAGAFWFEGYMQHVPPGPKEGVVYTVVESSGSIHRVIDETGVQSDIKITQALPRVFICKNGQVLSLIEKEME